jgi:alpha-tubulin suppressor-like RCC1 family protein
VLACGKNEYGRLGVGDEKNHLLMTPVPFFDQTLNAQATIPRDTVQMVACGGSHTIFLTTRGGVFVAGRGSSGRRGNGTEETTFVPEPIIVPEVSSGRVPVFVAAGGQHSICLYD